MTRVLPLAATLWIAFTFLTSHAMQAPPVGRSLALRDDGGLAVLTWDGEEATFFRDGERVGAYPADTWEVALWHHVSAWGGVTSLHRYDRALDGEEVVALERCDWTPSPVPVDCGTDAACGCR
ncbi:MAG: hypothetical protein H6735_25370 [Alphaproteobacteria bacterium]|nr:hypothetical protein [Alphaproteobacteria bacterium]